METLPHLFDNRTHNLEIYAQKRVYSQLKLLNKLPIVQNVSGEFTNYVASDVDDITGDIISTGDGLDFNEIKFGQGQTVGGQTLPIGFMYRANTRDEQRGRYDSNLQSFYNAAVVKIADFFEKFFLIFIIFSKPNQFSMFSIICLDFFKPYLPIFLDYFSHIVIFLINMTLVLFFHV